MDLADIRKKARAQTTETSPRQQEIAPLPATDEPEDALLEEEIFWREIGTGQFATEEEYTQGLVASGDDVAVEEVQWLSFFLGREEYALDLRVVSELIKPRILTELPQVPEYVRGIITLRGEVIPVVDLKVRLGLNTGEESPRELQRIIVCEGAEQRVGLLVDRISQVVRIPCDEIEVPQLVGEDPAAAFILGVGRKQGRMLIQLRPEKALEIVGVKG